MLTSECPDARTDTAPARLLGRGQVLLMLVLAEAGCRFVVVGSTARYVRGCSPVPRDLDIVVTRPDFPVLRAALCDVIAPAAAALTKELSPQRVVTGWSTLDVFVEDEEPESTWLAVDGVGVRVSLE